MAQVQQVQQVDPNIPTSLEPFYIGGEQAGGFEGIIPKGVELFTKGFDDVCGPGS